MPEVMDKGLTEFKKALSRSWIEQDWCRGCHKMIDYEANIGKAITCVCGHFIKRIGYGEYSSDPQKYVLVHGKKGTHPL